MENEDDEPFCKNCKRHISSANFATHSAFCERNIFVCKICEEPVPISEKDQHLEEYHVAVSCDRCETSLEKWLLPKHMELCPRRLVACDYCEAEFPFNKHSEHVDFCSSRTEKCLLCQKYVMNKEKAEHDELHRLAKRYQSKNIEDEIKQNKVNEAISKTSVEGEISGKASKEKHDNLTSEKRAVSRLAPEVRDGAEASFLNKPSSMIRKHNFEIPESEGATASVPEKKEFSKHHTECRICKQAIPWIDYNTHVPACASSAGKCALCGEDVANYAMKDHMKEHFQSRFQRPSSKELQNSGSYLKTASGSEGENYAARSKVNDGVIKCPFCSQPCSKDRISDHIRECPNNVYECHLCCEMVPEKDKNRHEKSECRMLRDVYEPSQPHISRNSSQISFECPLCNENIPEENREKHVSFECKTLLSSNIGDESWGSYKCPYCGSKMQEKNKAKHESFECPVLIENSGINPFVPESYADVTKKPCKQTCKCCQKSEICRKRTPEPTRSCQQAKFPCLHCGEPINQADEEWHLKFCPALSGSTKLEGFNSRGRPNSSNYEQKGAKPKKTDIRNMLTPRSAKCTYCHVTYNADIIKFHEDECLHKPIECPKCTSEMLLNDYKSHKCKGRRARGKNQTMEQQTAEPKDGLGLFQKLKKHFSLSDGKEEGKSGYMSMQSQDYYANHRNASNYVPDTEYQYFAQPEDPLLPCEFCQQNFPASGLVLHMTGCQPELVCYAKPDSREDSQQSESRTGQECASLPTKLSSVKDDTVLTCRRKNIQPATMTSPFFSGNSSFLKFDGHECKEDSEESSVEPGEFLPSYKSSSRQHEYPESTANGVEGKTEEPSCFQSLWNDGNLGKELHDKLPLDDSEMTDMLNFIEGKGDTEVDEEYLIHSFETDDKVKNSEKEVCSVLDDTQDEYRRDLPVSEKKTVKFICNSVQNQKECASQHLANFRFGTHKSTKTDNVQISVQPQDVCEEPESTENHAEHVSSSGQMQYLKLGGHDSPVEGYLSKMNKEEPGKMSRQKVAERIESSRDQRQYPYSCKFLPNFKPGMHESAVFPDEADCPVRHEKNGKMPEKAYVQKSPKSCLNIEDEKEYRSRCLANFKFGAHESTALSGEENEHHNILYPKDPEKLHKQEDSTCSNSTLDAKEYLHNFKQHLSDFKYGVHRTQSEDDKHIITSPEERNVISHRKGAFKLEPAESQFKEMERPSHAVLKKEAKALGGLDERIAQLQRVAAIEDDDDDITKWKKWRETCHNADGQYSSGEECL